MTQLLFTSLPVPARGILLLGICLLILLYISIFLKCIQLGRSKWVLLGEGLLVTAVYLLYNALAEQHTGELLYQRPIRLVVLFPLVFGLFGLGIWQRQRIQRWQEAHLSNISVKEAFDTLPTGICFARPSGLPKLVNPRMDEIVTALTGSPLRNEAEAWKDLVDGKMGDIEFSSEGYPAVRTPDGNLYSFCRQEVRLHGRSYYETIATDITEEYRLTVKLQKEQQQAAVLNTRLKALMETIEYVTMNRELLQIRSALHDHLGKCLLLGRRCLLEPDAAYREELLNMWRNNIRILSRTGNEDWEKNYYVTETLAHKLGIDLEISGRLPQEEQLINVVDTALSVHITNILRHAGGRKAFVRVEEGPGYCRLHLTNDGRPPAEEIRETGGLANLRREVENIGGSMEIRSEPVFEMILYLPVEERYGL